VSINVAVKESAAHSHSAYSNASVADQNGQELN